MAELRPIAVDAAGAGELFGVSSRSWKRWSDLGIVPAPTKLRGRVRWVVRDLERWAEHGCPPRPQWEAIRGSNE